MNELDSLLECVQKAADSSNSKDILYKENLSISSKKIDQDEILVDQSKSVKYNSSNRNTNTVESISHSTEDSKQKIFSKFTSC